VSNKDFISPIITDKSRGIYGHVDFINDEGIGGWVIDVESSEARVVEIYVNDIKIGEVVANLPRPDVASIIGREANCGFLIKWNELNVPNNINLEDDFDIAVIDKLSGKKIIGKHAEKRKAEFFEKSVEEKIEKTSREELPGILDSKSFTLSESDEAMLAEFDHEWFRKTYNIPIFDKIKLFRIYKDLVRTHKVSPNPDFNEKLYLLRYKDVERGVESGQFHCGFEHYVLYGKREGRSGSISSVSKTEETNMSIKLIEALFDEKWYLTKYPEVIPEIEKMNITPFEHYLKIGLKRKYSPNSWFDEAWYTSFYSDVGILVEDGFFISGFEHFLKIGRYESRIPRPKLKDILNFKYKDAIQPIGINNFNIMNSKLKSPSVKFVTSQTLKINIVVPTMDKSIMFGGYISLINIIKKILKLDVKVRFLVCEDHQMEEEYFWYLWKEDFKSCKDRIEFQNILKDELIELSENEIFISYSAFTTLLAYQLSQNTKRKKVIYLIQEDERIFYTYSSFWALIDYIYSLPITFLFNSYELMYYFRKNKIGPFRDGSQAKTYYFESVITDVSPPSVPEFLSKKERNLIFYARPEAHAGRNLFEIGASALRIALEEGYFDNRWNFIGIGAVDKYKLDIYKGRILEIKSKMSLEEYKSLLKKGDVGLFLMYAPHPGLVGFEMASAGMIVVVNKFDYRDENYFKEKSKNFIPADPDPYSIADALKRAVLLCEDIYDRIQNAYKPKVKDWDEAIPDDMLIQILGL
jgi:hypothetical protein